MWLKIKKEQNEKETQKRTRITNIWTLLTIKMVSIITRKKTLAKSWSLHKASKTFSRAEAL